MTVAQYLNTGDISQRDQKKGRRKDFDLSTEEGEELQGAKFFRYSGASGSTGRLKDLIESKSLTRILPENGIEKKDCLQTEVSERATAIVHKRGARPSRGKRDAPGSVELSKKWST